MRSLLVQGQFCLFVFYPECLWNLLKHFTSSDDRLQLHNEVVTFSKCLRETWDCRSDGGGGGVSGGGQRRDEKLRVTLCCESTWWSRQIRTRLASGLTETLFFWCFPQRTLKHVWFIGFVTTSSCKSGSMLMFLHSEGRKHVCVHKAQMITEEILSPSVAVGW